MFFTYYWRPRHVLRGLLWFSQMDQMTSFSGSTSLNLNVNSQVIWGYIIEWNMHEGLNVRIGDCHNFIYRCGTTSGDPSWSSSHPPSPCKIFITLKNWSLFKHWDWRDSIFKTLITINSKLNRDLYSFCMWLKCNYKIDNSRAGDLSFTYTIRVVSSTSHYIIAE